MPATIMLREMLQGGMRPESFTARNSPYLVNCLNRRPTREGGLQDFYTLTQPVTNGYITATLGESKTWPFPQLFVGRSVLLLAFADAIYELDSSTFLATLIDTKDPDDATGGSSKAITSNYDWHFLDMNTTWMLFNGSCVVWRTSKNAFTWCADDVTIRTGCSHKEGRALFGGFDPSDTYTRADWATHWDGLKGQLPSDYSALTLAGLGTNWVWWSSFMAPDLLWLLDADDIMDTSVALDLAWRNEANARPMPIIGDVQGLAEFGDSVVMYGNDGVRQLTPVGTDYAPREFAGLGPRAGVSISGNTRTHWAGDNFVQHFVDGEDELWRLFPDGTAERLGHSEWVSELDRDNLLLSYEPVHRDLYLADGTLCFMLADNKMCRAPWMPTTSPVRTFGYTYTIYFEIADPDTATIETGTITTESGEIETLSRVWMVGLQDASTGWTVKIKYRVRAYDDWTETSAFEPDSRAVVADINVPVYQFRLVIESADAATVTLEDVGVQVTMEPHDASDKLAASTPGAATE